MRTYTSVRHDVEIDPPTRMDWAAVVAGRKMTSCERLSCCSSLSLDACLLSSSFAAVPVCLTRRSHPAAIRPSCRQRGRPRIFCDSFSVSTTWIDNEDRTLGRSSRSLR